MRQFELRYLDPKNTVVLVRHFYARDNVWAMTEAKTCGLTHTLEIWKEDSLVGRIERPSSRRRVSRRPAS